MSHENKVKLPQEVSIPVSLYKSMQGRYFVGQSGSLWVANGQYAWAGLINPHRSGVLLYANVFTISNFSDSSITAEIWLKNCLPEKGEKSHKVSPTNTAICPPSHNEGEIRYVPETNQTFEKGVNVYKRIVPPNTTLVGEEDGKFIEAPGQNYVIFLKGSCIKPQKAIVALGWWENPIC